MKRPVTCRDGVSLLMDYTEGLLPGALRRAVEGHVGLCARCRGFVRSYRATPRILREVTAAPLPARVSRRLHGMVAALPGRRDRRPRP